MSLVCKSAVAYQLPPCRCEQCLAERLCELSVRSFPKIFLLRKSFAFQKIKMIPAVIQGYALQFQFLRRSMGAHAPHFSAESSAHACNFESRQKDMQTVLGIHKICIFTEAENAPFHAPCRRKTMFCANKPTTFLHDLASSS